MSDVSTIASVEHNGFTVTSNSSASAEALKAGLEANDAPAENGKDAQKAPDLSKAASDLGKKGGEAAAAKRAADAKEAKKAARETNESTEEVKDTRKAEEKPLGKPRDDPRARMLEATRKEAEAKREAATARAEAAAERAERARLQLELERARSGKPAEQTKPKSQGKPVQGDYDDWEEYLDARDEYNRRQWAAEQYHRSETEQHSQRLHEYQSNFSKQMAKFKESSPEQYEALSEDVLNLVPTFRLREDDPRRLDPRTWIADEIVDNAEDAPALMTHLSNNAADFQRIAALSTPRAVTRAMARLIKSLDDAPTDTVAKPTVSKAPTPVKPVTGAPPVAQPGFRPGMTLDEFARTDWKGRSR